MDKVRHISVVGILNITPDSFFESSRVEADRAMGRIEKMISEGADVIDIGACSTRPGSAPANEETEWQRLEPVLKDAAMAFAGAQFSIDTFRSSIVRKAFDVIGPFTVNDVTAGDADPAMLSTVAELGLEYVATHNRPCRDGSVVENIAGFFDDFAAKAKDAGVVDWWLDPGFGFSKTLEQNWELARGMQSLLRFGRPVYVGVSRKSMLTRLLGISPEEALPATQVLHFMLLEKGASALRVHDVAEVCRTVRLFRQL